MTVQPAKPQKSLRDAARSMREAHGPEHKRHHMWAAIATACESTASNWDWCDRYEGTPSVEMHALHRIAVEYLTADPS